LLDIFVRSETHRYDKGNKEEDENPNAKFIDDIKDEMFGLNKELIVYLLHDG
jgi:hypothetical protein